MENILITKELLQTELKIPEECRPKKITTATNIMVSVITQEKEGLLVLEYNPAWQTWFPFYDDATQINTLYDFKATTYQELIEEFEQKLIELESTEQLRKEKAIKQFKQLYEVDTVVLEEEKYDQYWIKYSKSQNIWSAYKVETYIAKKISPKEKLLLQNKKKQYIMPIEEKDKSINNMMLVDNARLLLEQVKLIPIKIEKEEENE